MSALNGIMRGLLKNVQIILHQKPTLKDKMFTKHFIKDHFAYCFANALCLIKEKWTLSKKFLNTNFAF